MINELSVFSRFIAKIEIKLTIVKYGIEEAIVTGRYTLEPGVVLRGLENR